MKFVATFLFCSLIFAGFSQFAPPCSDIPPLNQQILNTLKPYIGKKIDRGECWDAARLALDKVGANWDGLYVFGRVIDVKIECIQAGDVIQFEKVEVAGTLPNGGKYTEAFYHHTAIVYSVKPNGELELLHQNTGYSGRKMGVSPLSLRAIVKGSYTIYRPIPMDN